MADRLKYRKPRWWRRLFTPRARRAPSVIAKHGEHVIIRTTAKTKEKS